MYSTPELLLVGAAQHLVLGVSLREVTSELCGSGLKQDNIENGLEYDDDEAW